MQQICVHKNHCANQICTNQDSSSVIGPKNLVHIRRSFKNIPNPPYNLKVSK